MELTDRQLQFFMDEGEKKYGLQLNGARIWQFWRSILWIFDIQEVNGDVLSQWSWSN
jgi:hypothetical protein